MRAVATSYTVICKFHAGIDACDPWSEFAVVVGGVSDPVEAATAACSRLVLDNGGKAEASMVIAGVPELHFPKSKLVDAECEDEGVCGDEYVISYRELN